MELSIISGRIVFLTCLLNVSLSDFSTTGCDSQRMIELLLQILKETDFQNGVSDLVGVCVHGRTHGCVHACVCMYVFLCFFTVVQVHWTSKQWTCVVCHCSKISRRYA